MDELVKVVKDFIYRDVLYIISGYSVVVSFTYLFFNINILLKSTSTLTQLIFAGFCYIIGYCIQDGLSLTPLVKTSPITDPSSFIKKMYRRLENYSEGEDIDDLWKDLKNFDSRKKMFVLTENASDERMKQYNRTISLKQIGTTGGSSAFICFVLLLSKWLPQYINGEFKWELVQLTFIVLFVSSILLTLGWVKGVHQQHLLLMMDQDRLLPKRKRPLRKMGVLYRE